MATIEIIGASDGTLDADYDATAKCQELVDTGNDDITASNHDFGDPDEGTKKKFGIVYTVNGGERQARACMEGETIDLVPQ